MGFGSPLHWLIVLVVVLLIFGTKKLRNIGADLGSAIKGFKEGMKSSSDGKPEGEPLPPQQQVTTARPADANTVDVEAKSKS